MKDWLHIIERGGRLGSALKKRSDRYLRLVQQRLWLKVLVGLALGFLLGFLIGPDFGLLKPATAEQFAKWVALPGNIFLQLIKMVIIPLVFSSIALGIINSGNPEFLKKIGPRIAIYFIITTSVAAIIGFSVATIIQPGLYITPPENMETPTIEGFQSDDIPGSIARILPSNPIQAMVNGDMLGVVISTIIMALALLFTTKANLEFALRFLEIMQDISMRIVRWAMKIVPYAVFGLTTQVAASMGFEAILGLGMYILAVISGLIILLVFYGFILLLFALRDPAHFFSQIKDVQLLAFSTSSSAATMPLSMKVAEDKLEIKKSISEFLIPVGATVNMDGTALYQVVATVFLAQAFGIELSLMTLAIIIAITVGASIGAPAAPGTGIVVLATILDSAGIPATGIALILGVDRILDMSRTAVNVTGDLTACAYFNKKLAHLFESKPSTSDM